MVIVGFEEAMKMAAGENYRDIYVMGPFADADIGRMRH